MSEPRATATRIDELLPGLGHWSVHDERIDFRSEAYRLAAGGRLIVIDPLPLDASVGLERPDAIVITGAFHQRSAWSLRRATGAPVLAPVGATALDESPDEWYGDGETLDGGLRATLHVGPTSPHAVLRARVDGRRVLWCGDLVMRGEAGPFSLVPPKHRTDPPGLLASVRALTAVGCDVLCPAHGTPLVRDGTSGLRQAVEGEA